MTLLTDPATLGDATHTATNADTTAAALLLLLQVAHSCPRVLPVGTLRSAQSLYAPESNWRSFCPFLAAAHAAAAAAAAAYRWRKRGPPMQLVDKAARGAEAATDKLYRQLLRLHKAAADGELVLTLAAAAAAASESRGCVLSSASWGLTHVLSGAATTPAAARALLLQHSMLLAASAGQQLPLLHMQQLLRCCCCTEGPLQQPLALAVAATGADSPSCACFQRTPHREFTLLLQLDIQLDAVAAMGASSRNISPAGLELLQHLQREAAAALLLQKPVLYMYLQLRVAMVELLLRRVYRTIQLLPLLQQLMHQHHLAQCRSPEVVAELSYIKAMCCCHLGSLLIRQQQGAVAVLTEPPSGGPSLEREPQLQLHQQDSLPSIAKLVFTETVDTGGVKAACSLAPGERGAPSAGRRTAPTGSLATAGEVLLHAAAAHAEVAMAEWDTGEQAVGLRRGNFQRKRRRDMLVACLASAALRLQQAECEAASGETEKSSAARRREKIEGFRREFVDLRAALLDVDAVGPPLHEQQPQQQQLSGGRAKKESRGRCLFNGNEAEANDEALSWRHRDSKLKRQRVSVDERELRVGDIGRVALATLRGNEAAVCPLRHVH